MLSKPWRLYSASTISLLAAHGVCAQNVAPTGASGANANVVQDIVVTAQKRTQKLQSVAAAATALSGDSLPGKGVARIEDLQTASPALSVTNSGLTQNVNIRGIGLASGSPNAVNGVATYFDGVFQPPIVSTNAFYDIGSVEVFRGPQGTFVGSNSTGGAIFINSRDPVLGRWEGYFDGSLANYNHAKTEAAANIPVGDTFAIRAAGIYDDRRSYYTDIGPAHSEAGKLHEYSGRIGAFWKPSDHFDALIKVSAARRDTGGYAYAPIPGTLYAPYATGDIFTLDYSDNTKNIERAFQATAKLDYTTDGGLIFRSVSGYQNKRVNNFYDWDATNAQALPRTTEDQFVREREWSQEFNIISPTDHPLSWIAGAYFQRNRIDVHIDDQTVGAPVFVDVLIANKKTTTGIFGQVTYKLTSRLALDVGARYSHYSVTGTGAVTLQPFGLFLADPGGRHKDGRVTGKASLNWTLDRNNLLYAFVARGYKSGGFSTPTMGFKPETVMDYEAGWKSTLLQGHLRTQIGAFYYDYRNFQIDAIVQQTGQSSVINLGKATVKGAEAQAQARFGGLQLDGGMAYVDSHLAGTRFVDIRSVALAFPGVNNSPQCPAGTPSNPPACLDYTPFLRSNSGGPNLYSPKWTYNAGAQYTIKLSERSEITPRVNYAYVGPQWTYLGYDPVRDYIRGYGLLSAMLTFKSDRYSITAFGTNLANKRYVSGQFSTNEFFGAPREYGVRLHVDF